CLRRSSSSARHARTAIPPTRRIKPHRGDRPADARQLKRGSEMDEATGVSTAIEKRLVWDVPLRLFHWLLVLSLALLWFSQWAGYERLTHIPEAVGLDWMMIHMWLGYWTLGLIIFRLMWGVVGPRHARFASFFPSPDR